MDWIAMCGKKNNKFPAQKNDSVFMFCFRHKDTVVSPLKSCKIPKTPNSSGTQKKIFPAGRRPEAPPPLPSECCDGDAERALELQASKLVPCMERPTVQLTAVSFSVVRVECSGPCGEERGSALTAGVTSTYFKF
jgi:hypothetical protein